MRIPNEACHTPIKRGRNARWIFLICCITCVLANAQPIKSFLPENPAKPWVFWYWMQAAVSKAGITADLEAMKQNGIGGAYLMPIKGTTNPPLLQPPVEQLSPLFWEMVKFSMQEAKRLDLKMGMHFSDGFALGGGPWITPAMSMQKLVFSQAKFTGGKVVDTLLPKPEAYKDYLDNVAVLAFPAQTFGDNATPIVTTGNGVNAQFLATAANSESFKTNEPTWIQYAFEKPFTARSITIRTGGNNYQAQRLKLETSDDGIVFLPISRLKALRHGWQDTDADMTWALEPTTAKYFRFVYDKADSEPGAEDLDAAKWKPSLKLIGIELSSQPKINQYEAKSALLWRMADYTTTKEIADNLCVPLKSILNITDKMDSTGHLVWTAPPGSWTVLRIASTSTGHTNATGGSGIGLECDKFSKEAVKFQFDNWFGEALKQIGPDLAGSVLNTFHVDSWECGSQNWSPVFGQEFQKRRGYDLLAYLPAMAGIPVGSAKQSEQFLHDVRQTIAELVHDNFYAVLKELSHEKGCLFTAESVAPTMVSDGLLHYDQVDVPMGEFWWNSPTHDKPNDMFDAISGAHIYGKPIIQAEAFTTVRMDWSEHPDMLKTLLDRNYAMGINRLVYHVFTHNPWVDRKPGMTLDGVGLYFQRDQTWWKPGKAWVDYAARCQRLLQRGVPVADLAIFTGEDLPSRSILPDRLVAALPGIFGAERVKAEQKRLANKGEPIAESPAGVFHSANMALPEDWIDPLHGYQYDCINRDALLRLATVKNGRIVLPGGASYGLLVIPGPHPMAPEANRMSLEVARQLLRLAKAGGKILMTGNVSDIWTRPNAGNQTDSLRTILQVIRNIEIDGQTTALQTGPYKLPNFAPIGIEQDVLITAKDKTKPANIAWNHRKDGAADIYFLSNQTELAQQIAVSVKATGRWPELYDAVADTKISATDWEIRNGRTELELFLAPHQSMFVLLEKTTKTLAAHTAKNWSNPKTVATLNGAWKVQFDTAFGGPAKPVTFPSLSDWSLHGDSAIRYYSGTAVYKQTVSWNGQKADKIWLSLGAVHSLAQVTVNGVDCGVAWTFPYRVDITKALRNGSNSIGISVTNTWANRLIGDNRLPHEKRVTQTTAPFRLAGKPLLKAGLLGPVTIDVPMKVAVK